MAFTREHFIRLRPFLYHLTNPTNEPMLAREREMLCPEARLAAANAYKPQIADPVVFLQTARLQPVVLRVGRGCRVTLNDQFPLRSENSFAAIRGTYAEFLRCLNTLIFFWPGTSDGLRSKGRLADSFARKDVRRGWLRVPTADLWAEQSTIRFCRYNSGAPQARDGVERGPHIFVPCHDPGLSVTDVAEVVFDYRVTLPESAEWRDPESSEWRPLFARRRAAAGDGRPAGG